MLSLHFSPAEEEGEEEASYSDYIYNFRKDAIIFAAGSLTESEGETSVDEKETSPREDREPCYYLLNGFCMDEPYDMTVTDMETGKVL